MRFKRLSIAVAAVAATTVAGVGYAAVPGSDGTIHACYDNVSGQMRLHDAEDDSPRSCGSKESAVTWNQEGPAGPPGKRVIGGGARISGTGDWIGQYGVAMTDSWPHDFYDPSTNGHTGWGAAAREISSYTADWRLHAYAICATVAT